MWKWLQGLFSGGQHPCYAKDCPDKGARKCQGCDRWSCAGHLENGLCTKCRLKNLLGGEGTYVIGG